MGNEITAVQAEMSRTLNTALENASEIITREYLDRLLICLLQEYEKVYERTGRENSLEWLREICRILDGFYKKRNCPHMRFMYFKSMEL